MRKPRRRGRRGFVVSVSRCWVACRGAGQRVAVLLVMLAWRSFSGDLGDGGAGAGLIDDGFVGGVGGDEGLDREVVHRSREAAGDLVDQGERVVAEQGVGAAGQREVVSLMRKSSLEP